MALLGNRLDQALQRQQDRQTVGIPIGPDGSLVIAEVILAAIDARLSANTTILRGLRYIDDYELAFESRAAAEEGLGVLERLLGDFELELNPRKTLIEDLPTTHDHAWVSTLRSQPIRSTSGGQATDLFRLFDAAVGFVRAEPTDPILRYVVGRLRGVEVHADNRQIFQHLLLQYAAAEPGTLPQVLGLLLKAKSEGWDVEADLITETLNRLLKIPMGYSNEATWCIWGLFALELPVDGANVALISRSDDSFVALLGLFGSVSGRIAGLDLANWATAVAEGALSDQQWLLSYEAFVRGWLAPLGGPDLLAADPAFAALAAAGVRFFDETKIAGVLLTGVAPSVGTAPIFSL